MLRGQQPAQQVDDAFVSETGAGWAIGNDLIRYEIGSAGRSITVRGIESRVDNLDWHRASAPDSSVGVNGAHVTIGSSATVFVSAASAEWSGGVRLDVKYRLPSAALEIVRTYACYPGSPVIETWTTFRQEGGQVVTLSDLNNYELTIPNGTLHWVTGLQTRDEDGGPFSRVSGDLDDGQRFSLGSNTRASESNLPWFSVQADDREFFGSIAWSGSWQFQIERHGDDVNVQLGLPSFSTTLAAGASLETPHAVFGVTTALTPSTSSALRGFIDKGVRRGRPVASYVTYNTWYSKGTFIDEGSLLAEMELAGAMGLEQFVVDAGWWTGSDQQDSTNFTRQWGNWEVDPDRFPNGLGYLSDRAHELGMRFGVWVEPERVDLSTVGRAGLAKERFLAAVSDDSVPVVSSAPPVRPGRRAQPRNPVAAASRANEALELASGQICLADQEAQAWAVGQLVRFVDAVHPDYLKWDNNLWLNCRRSGHGHGTQDGNFMHHRGLQTVLDTLRERFPDLDIENCASGGNRLSLDMLARTDAAWLDDRTAPSDRVRHAVEGLIALLPSPYLLSLETTPVEVMSDTHLGDVPYVFRSRMLGIPGISWSLDGMDDGTLGVAAREVAIYKRLRPIQQAGVATLVSPQVQGAGWTGWDAVQYVVPGNHDAALLAYSSVEAPATAVVKFRGLTPTATYTIESVDAGVLGSASGAALMMAGVELHATGESAAHVIFLHDEHDEHDK